MRSILRRPAVGNLLLLTISLGVGLLAGELAVRLIRPQQLPVAMPVYRPADTVGYELKPGWHGYLNTGERPVEVWTDREGYRIGRRGRIEAATRVLVIGDSFMEAVQVPYEQCLAGLLEARLPASLSGRAVAVRDGGVAGYNPSQYLLAARRALQREHFDVLLVAIFAGNDVFVRRRDYYPPESGEVGPRGPPLRWPKTWNWRAIRTFIVFPTVDFLMRHSHTAVLLWNSSEFLRIKVGLWRGAFPSEFRRSRAEGPHWDATARIGSELKRSAAPIPVVFVVLPQHMQMEPKLLQKYADALGVDEPVDPDQPTRLLTKSFAAAELEVVDALAALRATYQAGTEVYGRVDRHLSPSGHEVLYQIVVPRILSHLRARLTAERR